MKAKVKVTQKPDTISSRLNFSLEIDLQFFGIVVLQRLFCQGIAGPFISNRCVPACPTFVESAALTAVINDD